jgi:hypothetical protein
MKTTRLFSLLFVFVLASACTTGGDSSQELESLKAENERLKKEIEQMKTIEFDGQIYSIDDVESYEKKAPSESLVGPRIPVRAARARLIIYKYIQGQMNPNYDPKKDSYGFTFSFDGLKDFVDDIHEYNQTNTPKIDGIRAYRGMKIETSPFKIKRDLFMIPTIADSNFYAVDDDFTKEISDVSEDIVKDALLQGGDTLLFNASTPCPFDCN